MRAFFERKRAHIRSRVFNQQRQSYFLLDSGAEREAAKASVFMIPGAIMLWMADRAIGLPTLVIGSLVFAAWAIFVIAIAFKAATEKSDGIYKKFTRKRLSKEYRDS